jgi:hypothetical protein
MTSDGLGSTLLSRQPTSSTYEWEHLGRAGVEKPLWELGL